MRYIGNKSSLIDKIIDCLVRHNIYRENMVFFDAFCGTGAVSYALRDIYNLILNDNLRLATTFAKGHIVGESCSFKELGFNPFDFFNSNKIIKEDFFYNNYAPTKSGRTYFSDYNAGRIDYFRATIENWYSNNKINHNEYIYLLCSLQESISKVANVAGVYGACLKKWDPRALKEIIFQDPDSYIGGDKNVKPNDKEVVCYNNNIEDIIQNVNCDILYLDPPYTKNKYTVQYHILETIIRNDKPQLYGKTGARKYDGISTGWSTPYEVEVLFEKIIAKTRANYILFSYSTDGLMSKDYIINVLKRHCIEETIETIEIPYKKYNNYKTTACDTHMEYLFYAEKKAPQDVNYYCPLNYMGGKSNIIDLIKPYLFGKNKFIDLFGGGFNVGINAHYANVIYNDINFIVAGLLKMFREENTAKLLKFIDTVVKKYNLEKKNKENYLRLRQDYNTRLRTSKSGMKYLYTIILYGFQQQIRFNSQYEFNNPVGESGYNECVKEKIVSFSRQIKEMNVVFFERDFELLINNIDNNCLVYADPPYLITLGSYNDGKRGFNGWNERDEIRLLAFLDRCLEQGAAVVISNILEYDGLENQYLIQWMQRHHYMSKEIVVRKRKEILIKVGD